MASNADNARRRDAEQSRTIDRGSIGKMCTNELADWLCDVNLSVFAKVFTHMKVLRFGSRDTEVASSLVPRCFSQFLSVDMYQASKIYAHRNSHTHNLARTCAYAQTRTFERSTEKVS